MTDDIYGYGKRIKSYLKKIAKDDKISQRNKELLVKFTDFLTASEISNGRIQKYLYDLRKIIRILKKDLDKANREDIIRVVKEIVSNEKYSEWTKRDFKKTLKKFYKWLRGGEVQPPEVSWFTLTIKRNKQKSPEQLLTPKEIQAMANVSKNWRDKAFVLVLYESGARIGELLPLKMRQISFTKHCIKIALSGKTGPRRIPLVSSVPVLTQWLNNHPNKNNPEGYVWTGLKEGYEKKRISYSTACQILRYLAKRSGIKKPVNPHHFRHSRATELAKHLTEAQLCNYMGWVIGSRQARTYVHLSGRDLDDTILNMYGIKPKEVEKPALTPVECARCGKRNSPGSKFCSYCGLALDLKTALELDQTRSEIDTIMDKVLEDRRIRRAIISKALKLGGEKKLKRLF